MTNPDSIIIFRRKLKIQLLASKINPRRKKQIISIKSQRDREETVNKERREQQLNSLIPPSDWVIEVKNKLNEATPCEGSSSWLEHCIFKVPLVLFEIDPKAYTPRIVSIGPYHRGNTSLKDMEKHKWRILGHVLKRTRHSPELYLELMSQLEEKTRSFYAQPMNHIRHREFVEMMLLDACFILELLRVLLKGFTGCGYSWDDPIFTFWGVLPCIQTDLLLVENQLPLFVLDRLFSLICRVHETDTVSQLALQFFDSVIPGCQNHHHGGTYSNETGIHFLHLVWKSLIPSPKDTVGRVPHYSQPQLMVHCVTRLRDSGVKFRKKNSDKFMDIEFKNGTLHIPPLVIHDSTKAIFLNLMVFEQCYPPCSNHVTSYLSFMDGLINNPRDVGYLRYQGIINHGLGSEEEVACLFNSLCREIAFDINHCYLSGVSADVNRYFDRKWNIWRATLKHEYFSNPWAIISVLAAIFLIGLTFAQTLYTIYPYYVPSTQ